MLLVMLTSLAAVRLILASVCVVASCLVPTSAFSGSYKETLPAPVTDQTGQQEGS